MSRLIIISYFSKYVACLFLVLMGLGFPVLADSSPNLPNELKAGKLIYQASLEQADSVSDWVMEGPGQVSFKDGWMHMQSPNEAMHHVFWCPKRFPESFIAQWDAQNMKTDAGLCIVFFWFTANEMDTFPLSQFPCLAGCSRFHHSFFSSKTVKFFSNPLEMRRGV